MTDKPSVDDLDLTDAELVEVVKNHGVDRRTLLKLLGLGSAATVLGSDTVAARGRGRGPPQESGGRGPPPGSRPLGPPQLPRIHPYLGYTDLPDWIDPTSFPRKPDHTVAAMIHLPPVEECGPFHFDPVGLHVEPGDVVLWQGDSDFEITDQGPTGHIAGDHTITAYSPVVGRQRRIPEAAVPFSSPMMGVDVSWYYRFETPGVYDVYCGPHEELGMVMRVVVGDVTDTDFGPGFDPESPPGPSNPPLFDQVGPLGAAGHVFENLDPETIETQGQIPWNDGAGLCPTS